MKKFLLLGAISILVSPYWCFEPEESSQEEKKAETEELSPLERRQQLLATRRALLTQFYSLPAPPQDQSTIESSQKKKEEATVESRSISSSLQPLVEGALDENENKLIAAILSKSKKRLRTFFEGESDKILRALANNSDDLGRFGLGYLVENFQYNEVISHLFKRLFAATYNTRATGEALTIAVRDGHLEYAKYILDQGFDVNYREEGARTYLMWASENGDLPMVELLIGKGAEVNITQGSDLDLSALILAVSNGAIDVVRYLCTNPHKKADVNLGTRAGWTPLMSAAEKNYTEILEFLVSKGAIVNHVGLKIGHSALTIACTEGSYEAALKLLELKADIEHKTKSRGRTALFIAVERGEKRLAEVLLQEGANPNTVDNKGHTPIGAASYIIKRVDLVALLIKYGAGINHKLVNGHTPLTAAARFDAAEVVDYLLSKGALMGLSEARNHPALISVERNNLDVFKILLEHGLPLDTTDHRDFSLLDLAALSNSVDVGEYILQRTAYLLYRGNKAKGDPITYAARLGSTNMFNLLRAYGGNTTEEQINQNLIFLAASTNNAQELRNLIEIEKQSPRSRTRDGYSVFYVALNAGALECAQVLIEAGAPIEDSIHEDGVPFIIHAIENEEDDIQESLAASVKFCLDKGFDPKLRMEGKPLLRYAIQNSKYRIAAELVRAGADINEVYGEGVTPLMLAIVKGDVTMVARLCDLKADINKFSCDHTALFYAVSLGHVNAALVLIFYGADVNFSNHHESTALTLAAEDGLLEVVRAILPKVKNIHHTDKDNDTALKLAEKKWKDTSIPEEKRLPYRAIIEEIEARNGDRERRLMQQEDKYSEL